MSRDHYLYNYRIVGVGSAPGSFELLSVPQVISNFIAPPPIHIQPIKNENPKKWIYLAKIKWIQLHLLVCVLGNF